MTLALRLSTVGMGICVGVSVGAGVDVDVGVSVGRGVNVSAAGMLVDVESGIGEAEAGGCSPPHADMVSVNVRKYRKVLYFMP